MGFINTDYKTQNTHVTETQAATQPEKKYTISPPGNFLAGQEFAKSLHNRVTISDRSSSTTVKTINVGNGLFLVSIKNLKPVIVREAILRDRIQTLQPV